MKASFEEKLIKSLERKYPKKKFAIAFVHIDENVQKEALFVDGQQINFCWSPSLSKMNSPEAYKKLLQKLVREVAKLNK